MKNLLKTTLLMGILLLGFLFSSQTTVAGTTTFDIVNSYYGGPELQFISGVGEKAKVTGTSSSFTVEYPGSFSGSVMVSYSLFIANLNFQNGSFSYASVYCLSDADIWLTNTTVYITKKPPLEVEETFTINNSSKLSFSFKDFTASSYVELKDRPSTISSGKTEKFTVKYMPQPYRPITSGIFYEYSSSKDSKGVLAIGMNFDQYSATVTSCAISPSNPKIIVGGFGESIHIEDTPRQVAFFIENNTQYSLSLDSFDTLGNLTTLLNRPDPISSGKVKEGSVSYPRNAKNTRFALKYKLQDINEYLTVIVFVNKEKISGLKCITTTLEDIVEVKVVGENKITISPIRK